MDEAKLAEQRAADLKAFEEDVANVTQQLPTHKSKEFTFTALEQQILAEQQTIITLAQNSQNKLINEVSLKRVGVIPGPDIHVRYGIGLGRFTVFVPRTPKKKA